jgi:predicted nucleic acid-binding protein
MADRVYIFDTSIISRLIQSRHANIVKRIRTDQSSLHVLCEPVIYEVEKGLIYRGAEKQLDRFQQEVLPLFSPVIGIQLVDWRVASLLWANARARGRQISDIDLLIAAVALRLDGIVVTADDDFDTLPVSRENWLAE